MWRPVAESFVAEATTLVTVSPRALVRLEGASYSVPCRWAGLDLVVHIGADHRHHRGPRRDTGHASAAALRRSDRSTIATTCQSSRGNRRRCARCCPICCGISGRPFPLVWAQLHDAYGPREAARRFAKILGAAATVGRRVVVPALRARSRVARHSRSPSAADAGADRARPSRRRCATSTSPVAVRRITTRG